MNFSQPSENSLAEELAAMPEGQREEFLSELSDQEALELEYDWDFWSRSEQRAPDGDWLQWMYLAGRGAGKTRTGAEWVRSEVKSGVKRLAFVGPTAADCRDVMVEGDSGILAISPLGERPKYEPSKRRLTWPNGAIATLFSAEDPESLRGPQFEAAWCDELRAWKYIQDTWDMLQFGLRLGDHPQCFISTTSSPFKLIRGLIDSNDCVVSRGSTYSNRMNLAPSFFKSIISKYEGTRLGRQEIHAEILSDVPGALWTQKMISAAFRKRAPHNGFLRVVVGVDPSGGDEETGDSQGIVVAGEDYDGHYWVIEDASVQLSPAKWGAEVAKKYHEHEADMVVAESNYGGKMVEAVIKNEDSSCPVKLVNATRGKHIRAEPIAALYEQGRVSHVGGMAELESQMLQMTTTGYKGGGSPDRLDAKVWALTELTKNDEVSEMGFMSHG